MSSVDSNLHLLPKRSTELANPRGVRPWIIIDVQFGNLALAEPHAIRVDQLGYVGPLIVHRCLTRPAQHRTTPFARLGKWAAIFCYLFLAQAAYHQVWQQVFDEKILFQNHTLSRIGTEALPDFLESWKQVCPPEWFHNWLHIDDPLERLTMAICPVKTERRSPIMEDQCDLLPYIKRLQQLIQVGAVLEVPIGGGATVVQLVGITHSNQVRCNTAPQTLKMRNDVAPDIGGGRIAMQEDNRIPFAYFDIGHLIPQNVLIFFLIRKCGVYHEMLPFFSMYGFSKPAMADNLTCWAMIVSIVLPLSENVSTPVVISSSPSFSSVVGRVGTARVVLHR